MYAMNVIWARNLASEVRSIARLMDAPVSFTVLESLTRLLLETAARLWWVLDPDVTVRDRVARAVTVAMASTHEANRAHAQEDGTAATASRNKDPHFALQAVQWAEKLGLEVVTQPKRPPRVAGAERQISTSVSGMLSGRARKFFGGVYAACWRSRWS
jgi:hypothetical protein